MKPKLKTIYVCTNCGDTSPKWMGKCSSCGEWNSFIEEVVAEKTAAKSGAMNIAGAAGAATASRLSDVSAEDSSARILSGINELDRVLGGGIVPGSVVLLGGEPGAGKSTMLLQLCGELCGAVRVLYVTGEESVRQIKLRAMRLNVKQNNITVAANCNIDEIEALIRAENPGFIVIDSVQTMFSPALAGVAGSVSQVKECAARFMQIAKELEIPLFIVGHVNKDGAIAGPKVMEHIVDTVMYFEGDRTLAYRILRAVKNRYGSTNEIGMFDMTQAGLVPVENPSEMLLQGRPQGVSGNCIACVMEGTRPFMSDIQALVTKTSFGTPRRAASGFDVARANLLLAVLEKRAGYFLGGMDVYINVVGGFELSETASDLPLCLAIVSSLVDKAAPQELVAIGEVGLGGEIRNVSSLEIRLKEAARIGFGKALVPANSVKNLDLDDYYPMEIIGVSYLSEAIEKMLA